MFRSGLAWLWYERLAQLHRVSIDEERGRRELHLYRSLRLVLDVVLLVPDFHNVYSDLPIQRVDCGIPLGILERVDGERAGREHF